MTAVIFANPDDPDDDNYFEHLRERMLRRRRARPDNVDVRLRAGSVTIRAAEAFGDWPPAVRS